MTQHTRSQKSRDLNSLTRAHRQSPESLLSSSLDAVRRDITMRKLSFFLWALLLVDGVFGVKKEEVPVPVSVMKGDSVTLNPSTEIPEDDTILWLFGKESIAVMNKAAELFSTSEGDGVGFKDRLELDHQTGSLTITNITNTDSGLYQLEIRSRIKISQNFTVSVRDVVESVSVMEGDTITLHTGVTDKQRDDQIQWKFKDQVIPTDGLNGWSYLNDQTGEITNRNIQSNQSGVYELKINTSTMILHRKLHITINGKMKTVSVTEGEPIILLTGLIEIQGNDLILWRFEDHLIAEINKSANRVLPHDTSDERFKGRLQPNRESGDLTIRGSRTTDSGVYHLNMDSSSHTVQRTISVTVSVSDKTTPGPGLSRGAVAGIVVLVLLLVFSSVAAGVFYCRYKQTKSELKRHRDLEKNRTTI